MIAWVFAVPAALSTAVPELPRMSALPIALDPAPRTGLPEILTEGVPEIDTAPLIGCVTAEPSTLSPLALVVSLPFIAARLPPDSTASADVFKFVPAFAVTVPEIVGVPLIVANTLSEPEESDHVRPVVHVPLSVTAPITLEPAESAGRDASETGCVVCQKVPATGTAVPPLTP